MQSVITAAQMILSVEHSIMELTGLEEIIVGVEMANELMIIGDIVFQAQGLSYDLRLLTNADDRAVPPGQCAGHQGRA